MCGSEDDAIVCTLHHTEIFRAFREKIGFVAHVDTLLLIVGSIADLDGRSMQPCRLGNEGLFLRTTSKSWSSTS